ncbi:hypothetical protein, partial [Oceanospirillum linum]
AKADQKEPTSQPSPYKSESKDVAVVSTVNTAEPSYVIAENTVTQPKLNSTYTPPAQRPEALPVAPYKPESRPNSSNTTTNIPTQVTPIIEQKLPTEVTVAAQVNRPSVIETVQVETPITPPSLDLSDNVTS